MYCTEVKPKVVSCRSSWKDSHCANHSITPPQILEQLALPVRGNAIPPGIVVFAIYLKRSGFCVTSAVIGLVTQIGWPFGGKPLYTMGILLFITCSRSECSIDHPENSSVMNMITSQKWRWYRIEWTFCRGRFCNIHSLSSSAVLLIDTLMMLWKNCWSSTVA